MTIIEITKKMQAEGRTVIVNPLYLLTNLAAAASQVILKMRDEGGRLLPEAQQELSLRGERIAFIEFHRCMYNLNNAEIAELKHAMKQFYFEKKLGESEDIYNDVSLVEDAIDYQFCLRGGDQNFSADICEEIAKSFKNNIKLSLQYEEIDSNHLIKFVKNLINKYREQERK